MCLLPLTACPSSRQAMVAILLSVWLVSLWLMTCKSGHFTILSLAGVARMPSHRRHPNLPGILTARRRGVQMHQVFLTSVELWCDVDKASWGHCDRGYPIFILKKGTPGQQVQLPETLLWLTLKGCVPVFREAGAQPTRAAGQPALISASFQPQATQ